MYFDIEKSGCSESEGLVEIRYDLYLDPTDARYHEHYVQVPVYPVEGYPGKVNEKGFPDSIDDFNTWNEALPKVWQNNPFCCHFVQFEPDECTDEAILLKGEYVMQEKYKHWVAHTLHKPLNEPVETAPNDTNKKAKSQKRIDEILNTDFGRARNQHGMACK